MLNAVILFFILFLNFSFTEACEKWFSDLKIKDSKSCLSKCTTAQTDMSSYMCTNQCDQLCASLEKGLEETPNFYDLTNEEVAFCKKDPVGCVKVYRYSHSAEQDCQKIYSVSDHNDESDACRHYM